MIFFFSSNCAIESRVAPLGMTTLDTTDCAIDRLIHHSIILELDGESFRMQHAKNKKQKGGD